MRNLIFTWIEKLGIPTKGMGFNYIKNTSWVTLSKLFESLFSYLIIVLISRYLGAEGLGQYSFMFAFVGVFFLFSDLGISTMLIKDLSKNFSKVNEYVSNVFTLKTILIVISFLGFLISLFFINKPEIFWALVIVGFSRFFGLQLIFNNILRVKHKGTNIAIIGIVERVIAFVGSFIVLTLTKDFTLFILVLFISSFVKFILFYLFSKKYFVLKFNFKWNFLKDLIKRGLPFFFVGIFATIYIQLDSIMLSFMKSDTIVGLYNSSYKLINILGLIPILLMTFGFPLFSKLFSTDKKSLRLLFEKLLKYLLIISIPLIIGVFFIGQRLLDFIYGFNSVESFIAFKILIIANVFIFLTTVMGQLIAAADKQKIFAYICGIGAVLNIILNFVLIPKYSLYGAGFSTLLTYVLMFILMFVFIKRNLLNFHFFKFLIIPFLSSIVLAIFLLNFVNLHLILLIILSIIIYFITLGVLNFVKSKLFS